MSKISPTNGVSLEDRFFDADSKATELQQRLVSSQKMGLVVTFIAIFLLAIFAFVMRTPAPQVLCPVAVFLMIQYLDRLRKSELTFHFASFRLAAETLRLMGASRNKAAVKDLIFSTRSLSTHSVADESASACEAAYVLLCSEAEKMVVPASSNFWDKWLLDQTEYYARASSRERLRSRHGLWVFNAAFTLVAAIGLSAWIWSLVDPVAAASDLFRSLMAIASVVGSCGLAYINFVRDRKAFDQSLDYERMHKVLSGTINPRVSSRTGEVFERMVATETLNEQMRWALRMAGHFKSAK